MELSDIYGQVMEDRHESDYDVLSIFSKEDAETDIAQARYFVEVVKSWLQKERWL